MESGAVMATNENRKRGHAVEESSASLSMALSSMSVH
jgi:hypothetical protein